MMSHLRHWYGKLRTPDCTELRAEAGQAIQMKRIINTCRPATIGPIGHLVRCPDESDSILANTVVEVSGEWRVPLDIPGQHVEVDHAGRRVWVQRCNLEPA